MTTVSYLYANFAESTIQAAMNASQTTLQVATADSNKFPSPGGNEAFRLIIYDNTQREIVECSSRSGNILTILRGVEGTAAQAWSAGAKVVLAITAGIIGQIKVTSGSITLTDRIDEAEAPDIISATVTNLAGIAGNLVHVLGTATITSFGSLPAGARRIVIAEGTFTLEDGPSLVLPYAGNDILVDVGDTFTVVGDGAGVSVVVDYQRKDGSALQETVTGVYGSVGATDNALVRANGITGGLIQGCHVIIDDSDNISTPGTLSVTGVTTHTGLVTANGGLTLSGPFRQPKGTDIASATNINLALATTGFVQITGTTTIAQLGDAPVGTVVRMLMVSGLTLTHSSGNLVVPGNESLITVAGSIVTVISLATNKWMVIGFTENMNPGDIYIYGGTIGGLDAAIPIASGGTNGVTALAAFDNLKQTATTSYVGASELATTAETQTGTDATRTITPAGLKGALGISRMYESTEQALSGSVNMTEAHGIGAQPKIMTLIARNKTAEGGYSIGDEILMGYRTSGSNDGIFVWSDPTNVGLLTGTSMTFGFTHKSSNVGFTPTTGNWKFVVRVWG